MTEHTLRVLLVEDDATSCMEINDYISRLDDVTLVASTNNASTAIEYMEKFLPDAVILDLELHQGGGDGLFFLAQLQQLELSKHPYILVTTNNSSNITYESARQLGADFILAKYQENYSAQYVVEFLRIMKKVIFSEKGKTASKITAVKPSESKDKRLIQKIQHELNLIGSARKLLVTAILPMQSLPPLTNRKPAFLECWVKNIKKQIPVSNVPCRMLSTVHGGLPILMIC